MGNVLTTFESFLKESSNYQDLKSFMDEMLFSFFSAEDVFHDEELDKGDSLASSIAKYTHGIVLDVVGGFGFRKETLLVDPETLSNETGKTVEEVRKKVNEVFNKHQSKINKRVKNGSYYFTYK
jgi:hypothetical protein